MVWLHDYVKLISRSSLFKYLKAKNFNQDLKDKKLNERFISRAHLININPSYSSMIN